MVVMPWLPAGSTAVILLCGWCYESVLSWGFLFLRAPKFLFALVDNTGPNHCDCEPQHSLRDPSTLDLCPSTDRVIDNLRLLWSKPPTTDHPGQTRWVYSPPRNPVLLFLHPGQANSSCFPLPCPWLHCLPSAHTFLVSNDPAQSLNPEWMGIASFLTDRVTM